MHKFLKTEADKAPGTTSCLGLENYAAHSK